MYQKFVREGEAAAKAALENILATGTEDRIREVAAATRTLSSKLLSQSALPSAGARIPGAGDGGESTGHMDGGRQWATPLLLSKLIEEKDKRHGSLRSMLMACAPDEMLDSPVAASPVVDAAHRGAGVALPPRATSLRQALSDDAARVAAMLVLRREHNRLASMAAGAQGSPLGDGGHGSAVAERGASLALEWLHRALSRASGAASNDGAVAFYSRIDRFEAAIPEVAYACDQLAHQGGVDQVDMSRAVARGLQLIIGALAAAVGAAEQAAAVAMVPPGHRQDRSFSTAPVVSNDIADRVFPGWLNDEHLTHGAGVVVAWFQGEAARAVGMSTETLRDVMASAERVAAAYVGCHLVAVAESRRRALRAGVEPTVASLPMEPLDRARQRAAEALAPKYGGGGDVSPGSAAAEAARAAASLAASTHCFRFLAALCTREDGCLPDAEQCLSRCAPVPSAALRPRLGV